MPLDSDRNQRSNFRPKRGSMFRSAVPVGGEPKLGEAAFPWSRLAEITVRARPLWRLKHPVNSVLAGVMMDNRRSGRARTVLYVHEVAKKDRYQYLSPHIPPFAPAPEPVCPHVVRAALERDLIPCFAVSTRQHPTTRERPNSVPCFVYPDLTLRTTLLDAALRWPIGTRSHT